LNKPPQDNIVAEISPAKGKQMKWDYEKVIHQELVGKTQQIQAKMDTLIELYPNISKDIKKIPINIEQDWQALPYHEM
jgi:DNA mismatch repair protein MutH